VTSIKPKPRDIKRILLKEIGPNVGIPPIQVILLPNAIACDTHQEGGTPPVDVCNQLPKTNHHFGKAIEMNVQLYKFIKYNKTGRNLKSAKNNSSLD
jgi:hypothetical protein